MPAWSNTDVHNSKPKWDNEREVRETVQLTTANTTSVNSNDITFTYSGNVATLGVAGGQSVVAIGSNALSSNGFAGFFASNNQVVSISGNNVTFASNVTASIPAGTTIEFDTFIAYNSNKPYEVNYNADTVLITPTRLANAVFAGTANSGSYNLNSGMSHVGWNKVTTFTGGRAGRVQTETLVVLANPTAANTLSGNTSNSLTYFAGV